MKRPSTRLANLARRSSLRINADNLAHGTNERKPKQLLLRRFWIFIGAALAIILALGGGLLAYHATLSFRIAELKKSCDQARRDGDWPTMERIAREWAALEPGEVKPWAMAASAARAMGELRQCAEYLAQMPDSAPVESFHELSLLQMESLILPFEARATCERALRLYPSDKESSLRLLFIHAMTCNRDPLIAEAVRAIRGGADSRATYAYLVSAKWLTFSNGYGINQFWLENDPGNETFEVAAISHLLFNRDLNAMAARSGNGPAKPDPTVKDGKSQLEALIARYPKNHELLAIALSSSVMAGDVVGVAEKLSSAPPETVGDNRFWRFKGWYHAASEEWDEAARAYEGALKLSTVDFFSQNELAGVIRRSQGIDAAKDMQTKANLGIDVALSIVRAANFDAISRAEYQKLAEYLELCGETEFANGLREHCE